MKAQSKPCKKRGVRDKVKVIIARSRHAKIRDEIGADGYGRDAAAAANLVKNCSASDRVHLHMMRQRAW
jgi:methanogenic corrinoid protein MtbC1